MMDKSLYSHSLTNTTVCYGGCTLERSRQISPKFSRDLSVTVANTEKMDALEIASAATNIRLVRKCTAMHSRDMPRPFDLSAKNRLESENRQGMPRHPCFPVHSRTRHVSGCFDESVQRPIDL